MTSGARLLSALLQLKPEAQIMRKLENRERDTECMSITFIYSVIIYWHTNRDITELPQLELIDTQRVHGILEILEESYSWLLSLQELLNAK